MSDEFSLSSKCCTEKNHNHHLEIDYPSLIATIAAASFCEAKRNKRYSGKREKAPKKERKIEDGSLRSLKIKIY